MLVCQVRLLEAVSLTRWNQGQRGYLLEHVGSFVVVHHSEEELVGERRGVSPGVSQHLVLLIGLPGGRGGEEREGDIFRLLNNLFISTISNHLIIHT